MAIILDTNETKKQIVWWSIRRRPRTSRKPTPKLRKNATPNPRTEESRTFGTTVERNVAHDARANTDNA